MWSCYTSARAGELSCSHERTADVLGLVQFSFRSHSKSLFCWPLHSASAFCIHNQPLSASLHSIAAVQHSSAPRPLFGCVVEHRIATAPAAFSTPDRPCSFPETRPSEASLAITRQPSLHHSLSTHPFHAGICLPRRVVFVITGEPLTQTVDTRAFRTGSRTFLVFGSQAPSGPGEKHFPRSPLPHRRPTKLLCTLPPPIASH
jgi:hypothetical protein